jgi:hypothetical protein
MRAAHGLVNQWMSYKAAHGFTASENGSGVSFGAVLVLAAFVVWKLTFARKHAARVLERKCILSTGLADWLGVHSLRVVHPAMKHFALGGYFRLGAVTAASSSVKVMAMWRFDPSEYALSSVGLNADKQGPADRHALIGRNDRVRPTNPPAPKKRVFWTGRYE